VKLLRQLKADAARSTGYQNGLFFQFHFRGSLRLLDRACLNPNPYTLQREVGTIKFYTYQKESVRNAKDFAIHRRSRSRRRRFMPPALPLTTSIPRIEALVNDLIGRVADKWTMLVLEVLAEKGELRFTRLSELVEGISQKMLTQTLRQMERDGLITRTVHPVVPPKVEYKLTHLGMSLGSGLLRGMGVGSGKPQTR
jgi:DNA-binding HxlR family transcriptional regulator